MIRSTLLAFVLPALLGAQALIQHSIAAAGGAATGAMMGKQVSRSLDNVLAATGAAEATTASGDPTAGQGNSKGNSKGYTKQMEGPYKVAPAIKAAPMPPRANRRGTRTAVVAYGIPFPEFPSPPVIERESGPIPPLPTLESMGSIESGAAGADVVARLGSPAARVTMSGDTGGLVEIYYYQSGGQSLGSVRLNDGAVSAVVIHNQ